VAPHERHTDLPEKDDTLGRPQKGQYLAVAVAVDSVESLSFCFVDSRSRLVYIALHDYTLINAFALTSWI
jgi:hypothetical protein